MKRPSIEFDLLSDFHIEDCNDLSRFNFTGMKTPDTNLAVVAGDLSNDPALTVEVTQQLSDLYDTVLFVDGNAELKRDIFTDPHFQVRSVDREISDKVRGLDNIHYLNDGAFIHDGVAFVGANGHWDFKSDEPNVSKQEAVDWHKDWGAKRTKIIGAGDGSLVDDLIRCSHEDVDRLVGEVKMLNEDSRVHRIIVATHTVPLKRLLEPVPENIPHIYNALMANTRMPEILDADINGKITNWVYGHQHSLVDKTIDGVRFTANPMGYSKQDGEHPSRATECDKTHPDGYKAKLIRLKR